MVGPFGPSLNLKKMEKTMNKPHPLTRIFGGPTGPTLDAIDSDGIVQLSVPLPDQSLLRDYAALLPEGCEWDLRSVYTLAPKSSYGAAKFADPYASGANPDFRPTSASQLENEMRLAVRRMNAATAEVRNAARQRAVAKLDVIPKAEQPPKDDKAKLADDPLVE